MNTRTRSLILVFALLIPSVMFALIKTVLSLGDEVLLIEEMVDAGGRVIVIDKPGDPCHQMEISFPEKIFKEARKVRISYRPITGVDGNPNFKPVTPLIFVECGDEYFDDFITVKIPTGRQDGFGMAFFYMPESNRIDALQPLHLEAGFITAATRTMRWPFTVAF